MCKTIFSRGLHTVQKVVEEYAETAIIFVTETDVG